MDYGDKIPPSPQYIFTPPRRYIFTPPLFDDLGMAVAEAGGAPEAGEPGEEAEARRRRRPARPAARFPARIERRVEVIEPASTLCPCGCGEMTKIGEDRSERLDIVPARFLVSYEVADDLRVRRAEAGADRMRGFAAFAYAARSWGRERRVVARLEASARGFDARYIVTSLGGEPRHLYEGIYCARGQAENLIKLHKVQLASDRTSCQSCVDHAEPGA